MLSPSVFDEKKNICSYFRIYCHRVRKMIVLFRSITSSLRVKKILAEKGIKSESVQTTKNPGIPSCGHALKIKEEFIEEARAAAGKIGVQIKGIYHE